MREIAVPIVIARAPMRTVRPSGLTQRWAQPAKELKRLRDNGVIRRLAHGHYIAPPDGAVARDWRPDLETAAMALATARYGDRVPVLMGMGAARFHRAVPRAFDRTVVAVPEQAHRVDLDDELGRVVFATRDTALLDARLEEFGIGRALVATPEQTVLDVAHRPEWGGGDGMAAETIRALWPRVDRVRLDRLAVRQGRVAARDRAIRVATREPVTKESQQ